VAVWVLRVGGPESLSTCRYLFPLIVRTGSLGVLSEPSRAVSLAIRVPEPIRVLRSFSLSPQSIESNDGAIFVRKRDFLRAQARFRIELNGEGPDLYRLWNHLHYIWPRRTPHRPPRPGFSAGVLRLLLRPTYEPPYHCLKQQRHFLLSGSMSV
jgi:hypothetical protein